MDRRKFLRNAIAAAVVGTAAEAAAPKLAEAQEMAEAAQLALEYVKSLQELFQVRDRHLIPEPLLSERFDQEYKKLLAQYLENFARSENWRRTPEVDSYAMGRAVMWAEFQKMQNPAFRDDVLNAVMNEYHTRARALAAESQRGF